MKPKHSTERCQNEMLRNLGIIPFCLSQNAVKTCNFRSFQLWQKNSFAEMWPAIGVGTPSNVSARNAIPRKERDKWCQAAAAGQKRRGMGTEGLGFLPWPCAGAVPAHCSGPAAGLSSSRYFAWCTLLREVSGAPAASGCICAQLLPPSRGCWPNAAFVAQHCMAERLQSASSMPVRKDYRCTTAEVSLGAAAKRQLFISYLTSRSHFSLAGDTKTHIKGN